MVFSQVIEYKLSDSVLKLSQVSWGVAHILSLTKANASKNVSSYRISGHLVISDQRRSLHVNLLLTCL